MRRGKRINSMIRVKDCISLRDVSNHFHIRIEECREFADFGLITILMKRDEPYIELQELERLKRIIRLYKNLGINKEGIEIILSMRNRIMDLQTEVGMLNRKVERLEREYIRKHIEYIKKQGLFIEI